MILPNIFHDAGITKMWMEDDTVYIDVDEFAWSESDFLPPTRITIREFRQITRNGVPVREVAAESNDGEIYRMKESDDAITLTIIWDGIPRETQYAPLPTIYRFDFATLEIALL
jgi:hypothetical protein